MLLNAKWDPLAVATRRAAIAERAVRQQVELIQEQGEVIQEQDDVIRQLSEQLERERIRREGWEAPPPCKCGHLTYEVWCPKCGNRIDQ